MQKLSSNSPEPYSKGTLVYFSSFHFIFHYPNIPPIYPLINPNINGYYDIGVR